MARKSLRQHVKSKQRQKKLTLRHQYKGGYKGSDGKFYTQEEGTALLVSKEAKLAEWHTSKKNDRVSYEGAQYVGGRKKGSKNLKRLEDGSLLNQHGVTFTQDEKKALENVVNRANRKRMQMLDDEGNLPRYVNGKPSGQTVASLQAMGKESDFILSRKHKSLQRFKSREEFERYLSNVERTLDPNYIRDRARLYKRNHMTAIRNVFGEDAKDVLMKIRMMPLDKYMEMIQKDEMLEVTYIYDPSELAGKLNQIRASLGMNLKEQPNANPE